MGGVGSVGVGTAVDGGAGGGEILPPPALGELEGELYILVAAYKAQNYLKKVWEIYQAEDGDDHDEHEDESRDGDADGKVALREADRRRVVDGVLQSGYFEEPLLNSLVLQPN